MNADAFRHLYAYHLAENRKLWDIAVTHLSEDQFRQPNGYSLGSIRNQFVHLMDVDSAWFGDLRGAAVPGAFETPDDMDRTAIRAQWDAVEGFMNAYLADLRDDMLADTPLEGEDAALKLWQVLLHVANHGTDHRAQILRLMADAGVRTPPQDYIFYVYGNP